ncbi:MAG: hypothetical protein ABF636_11395 [Acetobacter sp.]|uniref:Uncharacterized protein n=1 Tax=Acetobacter lovaniensis TaxID=104100 RepID=A0A841QGB6_9PROT|nr:hypothetical protein [Acetobacter lovaniensis]MBB6457458.1 hypothetical protein [Acetobacter lovaniensis]NHN81756.1 hypothetical protein [Acetobacter lovaniensis]GBQ70887.1 hypothetical protein AA0474_2304 [Acetobacter lovaniensis NRIC 0474]
MARAPQTNRAAAAGRGGEEISPDELVTLLSQKGAHVPRRKLIIVCREPGFRRADMEHPAVGIYPHDHFTAEQISAMVDEPMLELIGVGL